MGLIGALMAIPIAAGIKVLLSERLQARDAADADAAALGDGETAPQPGQARSHTLPPPDSAPPVNGRSRPATRTCSASTQAGGGASVRPGETMVP